MLNSMRGAAGALAFGFMQAKGNAPPLDPSFASVVMLLHGDGADGGTIMLDEKGHAATRVGAPVTSMSQHKFGASSILLDGVSAIQYPTGVDFQYGTGDFTIEAWVLQTARNSVAVIVSNQTTGATPGVIMYINTAGNLVASTSGGTIGTSSMTVSLNVWTHVAFSRNSGTLRVFVDGVQGFSGASATNMTDGICQIGQSSTSQRFTGYIDELRITKGVGRYSSAFTPSAVPFSNA